MYDRYGYILDEAPYTGIPDPLQGKVKITFKNWISACRGVGGQHLDSTSLEKQQPIIDFLNILSGANHPLDEVPAKYWDLNSESAMPLGTVEDFHFHIEVKTFDHVGTLCLLHPRDLDPQDHPSWLLAVSPLTALECIRLGMGPDPRRTAQYLLNRGIAFRTLQSVSKTSLLSRSPQTRSSTVMLGCRPENFCPSAADYAAYQTFCISFLAHHPYARVARMAGGIIGRIAKQVIYTEDILAGPSQSALRGERGVFISNGDCYVDDELSIEEKELICGTYQKGDNLSSRYSWYPRDRVWEASGLNVGHWNQECEDFFQNRSRNIFEGGNILSGEEWRNRLRLTKAAGSVRRKLDLATLAYLESLQTKNFMYTY